MKGNNMFDQTTAEFAVRALKDFQPKNPADNIAIDRLRNILQAMGNGDTIASLWSVEDVYAANGDCVIEQTSEDGEDDGLTWFYCSRHGLDTLDTQFCEEHPPIVTHEQARQVLRLVEHEHDAEMGINWDVLKGWITYVQSK